MCLGQDDAPICATPLRASPDDAPAGCRRSTRRSRASPRAMTSSSTAAHKRAGAGAPHVADRRLTHEPCSSALRRGAGARRASRAARICASATAMPAPTTADIIVALGGDGFMLQTLHAFLGTGETDLRHESRLGRLSDERVSRRTICSNAARRRGARRRFIRCA